MKIQWYYYGLVLISSALLECSTTGRPTDIELSQIKEGDRSIVEKLVEKFKERNSKTKKKKGKRKGRNQPEKNANGLGAKKERLQVFDYLLILRLFYNYFMGMRLKPSLYCIRLLLTE